MKKNQNFILFYFIFFTLLNFYFYFILLYNTVLVFPYIDMNPPQVYMSFQPSLSLPVVWTEREDRHLQVRKRVVHGDSDLLAP